MSERRLSLGINISILVMLTIFGVLLSLPLRLLLSTKYHSRNNSNNENETIEVTSNTTIPEIIVIPVDYRKLKRCPRFQYAERLKSIFVSYYDRNCTYTTRVFAPEKTEDDSDNDDRENIANEESIEELKVSKEILGEDSTESTEKSEKNRRMKSIPVAGHILAMMLLVSAISAIVEVLRIRFARNKDSSRAGTANSRRESTVELPMQRSFIPRHPMKSQRSFEMQGMHRSTLRLLGARPPPLIRRSSFPTQQAKQNTTSVSGTPNNRMSRRQSAESDEEIGVLMNALHHRTRLIRRH